MKYTAIYQVENNMVSHKRLQQYKRYYGKTCMTGFYGCRWHRYQQSRDSTSLWDVGWFCLLVLLLLFMLTWLLYWVAAYNDDAYINEILFEELDTIYYDWHRVLLCVTSATFAYVAVLFILALLHASYGHELYMHGVHKMVLVLILTGCIVTAYFVTMLWPDGWTLLYLSILANWPFIHLTIVAVMTLLTLLIAKRWQYLYSIGARVASLALFIAVIVFIYLSPLLVAPPCVVDRTDLPPHPKLIAHRGGAAMAPENTLLAFQWSSKYTRVSAFECDIQLSSDDVPFLMRDLTLRRTTNVSVQFPSMVHRPAARFNISDLQSLNAGQWFLDTDPFHTAGSLSPEERVNVSRQTVPTLEEVVSFVKTTNKSLLLHILPSQDRSESDVLLAISDVIDRTGIDPKRILWPNATKIKNLTLPFAHVLERSEKPMELLNSSIQLINLPYKATNFDLFGSYQSPELNLSVNLFTVNSRWLYSVCWCAGISSVTTNDVVGLTSLTEPLWIMSPLVYLLLWLVVDVVSACAIVAIFIYHRVKKSGVMFNPETLSLQAMQHRIHQNRQNRTMKEKLLHTAESIHDMDAVMLRVDSPSSPTSPATPATVETPTTPISPLTPNTTHSNGALPNDGNISYSRASGFFGDNLIPQDGRKENGIYPESSVNKIPESSVNKKSDNKRDSGVFDEVTALKGGHENRASGFFDEVPTLELEADNVAHVPNGSIDSSKVPESEVKNGRRKSLNKEIQKFFEGTTLPQTVMDRFEQSAKAAEEAEEEQEEGEPEVQTHDSLPPQGNANVMVNGYHGDMSEPENQGLTQPLSVQPTVAIETASQEHNARGLAHVTDVNIEIV